MVESVYSAVRTDFLYKADYVSSLKIEKDLEETGRAPIRGTSRSFCLKRLRKIIKTSLRTVSVVLLPVSALHPLQIWLHALRICRISKTNMLIRSEPQYDNTTNSVYEKRSVAIGRECEQRTIGR